MKSGFRIKLIFRAALLVVVYGLAIYDFNLLKNIFFYDFGWFNTYHIVWAVMMGVMLQACIPGLNNYVACGKLFAKHFKPNHKKGTNIKAHTRKDNYRAVIAAVIWALTMIILGVLYYMDIINSISLILIVVLFNFLDQLFINYWCPFKAWIIKNKCCNTCRIFNWGYLMIVSPLVYIFSFWTYSLIAIAAFILVQWEIMHHLHPERFSEISNLNLRCANCSNDICSNKKTTIR